VLRAGAPWAQGGWRVIWCSWSGGDLTFGGAGVPDAGRGLPARPSITTMPTPPARPADAAAIRCKALDALAFSGAGEAPSHFPHMVEGEALWWLDDVGPVSGPYRMITQRAIHVNRPRIPR